MACVYFFGRQEYYRRFDLIESISYNLRLTGSEEYDIYNRFVLPLLVDSEQLLCKGKIRVCGIPETPAEDTKGLIIQIFCRVMNLPSEPGDYNNVYRSGGVSPRNIIVNIRKESLLRIVFKRKHMMARNKTPIFQHLCDERLDVLCKANALFKKENVKVCNGMIEVKTPNGDIIKIGTVFQLEDLWNEVRRHRENPNRDSANNVSKRFALIYSKHILL